MTNSSFYQLEPDIVLKAAEEFGFISTGEILQLNSYENRVFEVKVEPKICTMVQAGVHNSVEIKSIIGKFYRPNRWSREALVEEHEFLFSLQEEGIHAVAPYLTKDSQSLVKINDMWVSFFPKVQGRLVQEFGLDELRRIGSLIARVHNVGSRKKALHRPSFDETHPGGDDGLAFLQNWIAPEVRVRYNEAADTILSYLHSELDQQQYIRLHGDTHRGNLLDTGKEFFLVDFDDFGNGLPVQDFWMLLSGDPKTDDTALEELDCLIEGYEKLRSFDINQVRHISGLRGLRIISYASWIAKRWEDPSFPKLFPEFNSYSYWAEEVEQLEKIAWSLS